MIPALILFGAPLVLLIWLAGLPAVWRGQPNTSLLATKAGVTLGTLGALGAAIMPAHSTFWFWHLGDGEQSVGILVMFLLALTIAVLSIILFALTKITAKHRSAILTKETF